MTPWTVARQAPLSMGFFRQEYWSGLPFPSPGDLSNPGIEPGSPALQADTLSSEPPGKPLEYITLYLMSCSYKNTCIFKIISICIFIYMFSGTFKNLTIRPAVCFIVIWGFRLLKNTNKQLVDLEQNSVKGLSIL